MKHVHKVSRAAWAGLALSALLCGAVWAISHRLRPVRWAGDPELTALAAERDRLPDRDDRTRDALRRQQRTAGNHSWTDASLADFQRKLGSDWRWQAEPAAPGAAERRFKLTAMSQDIRRWPDCMAAVETLEKLPGVAILSLEITATGTGRQRRFTRIVLGLRLVWHDGRNPGNAERAAALFARSPFRGGVPGPAVEVRTSVPALRPPSASAAARPRRLRLPARLRSGPGAANLLARAGSIFVRLL
jgi:hypothetical protein